MGQRRGQALGRPWPRADDDFARIRRLPANRRRAPGAAARRDGSSAGRRAIEMISERLHINEIFYSIQGESTHAGRPCVFVRLTGCNLRCKWCDTEYAFYEGHRMSISEITEKIRGYRCDLVEVTGGEPLLQEGVYPLTDAMLEGGATVMIETSGSIDGSKLDPRVIKIIDLKCPGSGESERNLWG